MTNKPSPPSRNTASDDSLFGAVKLAITKALESTDNMLPAKVVAYNRATNRARVQPLISMVNTNNQRIERGQIASIPVLQLGGGGFVLSFPINAGDLGWIKANDRDISHLKPPYNSVPPNTMRKHSFSDALFIPDSMMNAVMIAGEDANHATLQNKAGTVKIALWSDKIKMLAPKGVGIGGTPNDNAILDLQSTTKAFMFPRMTTSQRNAIPSPQEGMAVWLTDTHALSTHNGSAWS